MHIRRLPNFQVFSAKKHCVSELVCTQRNVTIKGIRYLSPSLVGWNY